jgi:hypothetical protein
MTSLAAKTESDFLVLGSVDGREVKMLDFHNFDYQASGCGSGKGLNKSSYFVDPATGPIVGTAAGQAPLHSYYKEHMGVSAFSAAKLVNVNVSINKADLFKAVSQHRDDTAGGTIDWEAVAKDMNDGADVAAALPIEYCMQYRSMCWHKEGEEACSSAPNTTKWGASEEALLMTLVAEHEEHDWVSICNKLGTQRTPMDCLRRYQQALNGKMIKVRDWTLAEEDVLRSAVATHGHRRGSWQAVSDRVPGRTAFQCQLKWRRVAAVNEEDSGNAAKWTEEDERRLFFSIASHGVAPMDALKKSAEEIDLLLAEIKKSSSSGGEKNTPPPVPASISSGAGQKQLRQAKKAGEKSQYSWMDVSKIIPGKSESRCRDKWIGSLDNSITPSAVWTTDENLLLRHLVQQHGTGNWGVHSEWLPGRTDAQVGKQWSSLSSDGGPKWRDMRKRKLVLPPAMNRKVDASQLDIDDFVQVLKRRE